MWSIPIIYLSKQKRPCLSKLLSDLEIPVREIKQVQSRIVVVTENISRQQLQDLAIQDQYLKASYKILQ